MWLHGHFAPSFVLFPRGIVRVARRVSSGLMEKLMRPHPSIILALLCAVFLAPASAQEYSFTYTAPQAGQQRTQAMSMKMSLGFQVEEGTESSEMQFGTTMKMKKTESIVTMDGNAWRSLRVVYHEYDLKNEAPMEMDAKEKPEPVLGVPYLLTMTDSLTITRDDNVPLTIAERAFLEGEYTDTEMDRGMARALNGKTLKVGDSIALTADMAEGLISSLPNADTSGVRSFSIRLREVITREGRQYGRFEMFLDFFRDEEPAAFQMKLQGETLVDVTSCRPASMKISGPIDFVVAAEGVSLNGHGTLETEGTFEYRP